MPHALDPADPFVVRHLGPSEADVSSMLETLGLSSLDQLVDETVPRSIRAEQPLTLDGLPDDGLASEHVLIARLRELAGRNRTFRSYLGLGYHGTFVPPVVQRNILENPGWYTQYTPYQAEISQGRLEALLNFQTMVSDLTGLPVSNASLLDEATAAAEAMAMCFGARRQKKRTFFVDAEAHPQTLAVLATRAEALDIDLVVDAPEGFDPESRDWCGMFLQNPATDGRIRDLSAPIDSAREAGVLVVMACDLLASTLLRSPGELGADIAVGSAQRFGVPLGFGGPHAAFLATSEALKRQIPGRIIGVSKDRHGNPALRMAMQTREQHIRREKATSNICTAQVLLAIMAGMYAVWHGPEGLRQIARRVRRQALVLAAGARTLGFRVADDLFFDTVRIEGVEAEAVVERARARSINVRRFDDATVVVALDETVGSVDLRDLLEVLAGDAEAPDLDALLGGIEESLGDEAARATDFLLHPVFHSCRTEHEMLRYIRRLERRDLSLTSSMIPLGSCTMKLNATAEMMPISFAGWSSIHPFAPADQAVGYDELFRTLGSWLTEITGMQGISLQPNAGAQGEYTGLLVIRAWHHHRGDDDRDVCLIPVSAHGTNPASAVMAGFRVVAVQCDERGNVDVDDLRAKADEHRDRLAALMVTYPSTHGVFEERIREICDVVHEAGGQVYLDGANLNAQVGLCRPGDYGADVCHLNLHKTFCIPHGGGGPGMGPIVVREHLAPFLPGHPLAVVGGEEAIGPVSAAPWGSASILPIPWAYIAMMGGRGLTRASQVAILNANYMMQRLEEHYPILYHGANGRCAHEFIVDLRPFDKSAHVSAEDVAKRLMDFGFHAPTMSFPVAGTLMIEPTESESREELDRLCDALILIRDEIRAIEDGEADPEDHPLHNAPHTQEEVAATEWTHPYSRETAAFPAPWVRENKFWPFVGRIDNVWGDRHLICTCPPVEEWAGEDA